MKRLRFLTGSPDVVCVNNMDKIGSIGARLRD